MFVCEQYHIVLVLPDWHGDGVVEDERPDHTQDQLQVPVHDGLGVWTQVRGQVNAPLSLLKRLLIQHKARV
jgi:hypothetical protein